jgi:hypothetical protein
LGGVQRRRQSLYRATLALEAAVSSPTGDFNAWRSRALAAAGQLHEQILVHVAESEQPGEFLDSITTQAPHLVSAAKKLASEHHDLILGASDLVARIEALPPTAEGAAAQPVRNAALELMGRLVRHRQRGTDLVYLAYGEDLGSDGG